MGLRFGQGQRFPGTRSSQLADRAPEATLTWGEEEMNRRRHRNHRREDGGARAPRAKLKDPGVWTRGSP